MKLGSANGYPKPRYIRQNIKLDQGKRDPTYHTFDPAPPGQVAKKHDTFNKNKDTHHCFDTLASDTPGTSRQTTFGPKCVDVAQI